MRRTSHAPAEEGCSSAPARPVPAGRRAGRGGDARARGQRRRGRACGREGGIATGRAAATRFGAAPGARRARGPGPGGLRALLRRGGNRGGYVTAAPAARCRGTPEPAPLRPPLGQTASRRHPPPSPPRTFSWARLRRFWTFLAKMPVFMSAMAGGRGSGVGEGGRGRARRRRAAESGDGWREGGRARRRRRRRRALKTGPGEAGLPAPQVSGGPREAVVGPAGRAASPRRDLSPT